MTSQASSPSPTPGAMTYEWISDHLIEHVEHLLWIGVVTCFFVVVGALLLIATYIFASIGIYALIDWLDLRD